MDEERARRWQKFVTLGIPDDEDEEDEQPEEAPAETEDLEAIFNGSSATPPTHQPVTRRPIQRAFLDEGSDDEFDF